MRIGQGYDVHKLVIGRKLIIGGVDIPYKKGLLGHSDSDVLIHAIIDSLFGACALRDIGYHFPDNNEKYKNISSIELLKETNIILYNNNYEIINIDSTIIIQEPKLSNYIDIMRENISTALKISIEKISIKAKTEEKLGYIGNGEGVRAEAISLIKKL
ncbi:MAG: 2-C-methyl-D-erythritol 2,4-cyclodiphosphate synthase [Eubacteriales bacterium]|nr:2-C-methyl-D-erythritol 2,4-cyclodiphosphate synthase [Eubacteriales bacterium]